MAFRVPEMEAKAMYMLGQHCTAEPCSSLILPDLEGDFGVGVMPALEQLRIKMERAGGVRRATLPQRGAAVHVSPRLTLQSLSRCPSVPRRHGFTRPPSPACPGATRVYSGTRGPSGTEARVAAVLSW